MSDLNNELSPEDQQRYAEGYPTGKMRRKGLFIGSGVISASVLATVMSLPSGEEVKPDVKESFENKEVSLLLGEVILKKEVDNKKLNIRLKEDISKSDPNTVSWDSIVTENGALSGADAIKITNPIITYGHNPDINFPDEQNKSGEWINFPVTQGRWLKVSFSSKTSDFVEINGGEKIEGHPSKDGGFLTEDKSTIIPPEEIAVVEIIKSDS